MKNSRKRGRQRKSRRKKGKITWRKRESSKKGKEEIKGENVDVISIFNIGDYNK